MARKILDGVNDFSKLRVGNYFYVDKTAFIREWWAGDVQNDVSLITRPRRFGKTLMLSTMEQFFSLEYAGRSDLFDGLDVWKDEEMRCIQGTWPVIFFSLADVKGSDFTRQRMQIIRQIIKILYKFQDLNRPEYLSPAERKHFTSLMSPEMSDDTAFDALNVLCFWLHRSYGKKVIVLLDEYDTPLQEAWVNGFWDDLVAFLKNIFNSTFKGNLYLQRGIITGITRVSKESIFSDLNNLRVYSISKPRYSTAFGFTEDEVFAAMDEYGLTDKAGVKAMYDGYIFGGNKGIYNPWSVVSYLQDPQLDLWWSNTSSNALVGKLVREGSVELKQDFQTLLKGGMIKSEINDQIVYDELGDDASIWSLLLASGYLKADQIDPSTGIYTLSLTNGEVTRTVAKLVKGWFKKANNANGYFVKALLDGDLDEMNEYMNEVTFSCFSSFDTGGTSEKSKPERFYHGFVLGLLVELPERYILTSNRESGAGRYDVVLEPRKPNEDPAFVIEFKVHKPRKESSLEATVAAALAQIEEKGYEQELIERGIPADRIRKYGFAFKGKEVLIGQGG